MSAQTYIGILDGDGNVWGVRIPDLPGAYGGGATADEAIASAAEAARIFTTDCRAKGIPIPAPRPLDAIHLEIERGERAVPIQVDSLPAC